MYRCFIQAELTEDELIADAHLTRGESAIKSVSVCATCAEGIPGGQCKILAVYKKLIAVFKIKSNDNQIRIFFVFF